MIDLAPESFVTDITQRFLSVLYNGCRRRPISDIFWRSASVLVQGSLSLDLNHRSAFLQNLIPFLH